MKEELYGLVAISLLLFWLFRDPQASGNLIAQIADQNAQLVATAEGRGG